MGAGTRVGVAHVAKAFVLVPALGRSQATRAGGATPVRWALLRFESLGGWVGRLGDAMWRRARQHKAWRRLSVLRCLKAAVCIALGAGPCEAPRGQGRSCGCGACHSRALQQRADLTYSSPLALGCQSCRPPTSPCISRACPLIVWIAEACVRAQIYYTLAKQPESMQDWGALAVPSSFVCFCSLQGAEKVDGRERRALLVAKRRNAFNAVAVIA